MIWNRAEKYVQIAEYLKRKKAKGHQNRMNIHQIIENDVLTTHRFETIISLINHLSYDIIRKEVIFDKWRTKMLTVSVWIMRLWPSIINRMVMLMLRWWRRRPNDHYNTKTLVLLDRLIRVMLMVDRRNNKTQQTRQPLSLNLSFLVFFFLLFWHIDTASD